MINFPIHRRGPLISALVFIIVLVVSMLLIALWQFDIGSYKQQLADRLEQALNKPVKLGDAKLEFQGGIALVFSNLQIGGGDNFSLQIPQLSTVLKPLALLHGEIVIEQVLLDAPKLKISRPLTLADSTLNLDQLGLKTLQIRKGSLTIYPSEGQDKPLRVDNFNLIIHGLGKGLVSQLATTATLSQANRNVELNLFLELTRQYAGQPWRQGQLRGNIALNNFQHNLPINRVSAELPKQLNLRLGVRGVPAEKVLLEASIEGSSNGMPLFSLSSDWQSSPSDDNFRNLKIGLDGLPLTGQLRLNREGSEPQLTGRIELGRTQLKTLLARVKPLAKLSGYVETFGINFHGPLHGTMNNSFSPLLSAHLQLKDLFYPFGPAELTDTEMVIEMQNARLSLKEGQGNFAHTPFTFTATSGLLNHEIPEITFTLNSMADLNQLQTDFSTHFLRRQTLAGQAPIDLVVQGPLNHLQTNLIIDLSNTELALGKLLDKTAGSPLTLELNGLIEPGRLTINQAYLNTAQDSVQLTGGWTRENERWSGVLQLAPLQLETLQPFSPIFDSFKIKGEAQGQIRLKGTDDWGGQFSLSNGGAHLTTLLSDLNQVNGILQLNPQGFDLGKVQARLGQSAINVTGGLSNWKSPLLSLQVTGKELRAQDLIFTNQQMMLQDLEGQLLISAGGITFNQIRITVEHKTTARIEGVMRGYHTPQTYLEINSDKADILDIIRLFTGPQRVHLSSGTQHNPSLKIKANAVRGSLGSLTFENAEATITVRNNIFTIFPLDFNLGEGTAAGRVEIDKLRNKLLKISGHVQNCDADSVYEMLFEKKGIFRGTLSGDFYIEGEEIGDQFWKTSQGGGHLQIRDGVLREFRGFAQIFSLLNVSQLFTFSLPDMDKEGLPISLLESSARITDGIVHFDDFSILSPAINISAVGQIDSLHQTIDSTLGIKPLRTVDIILSRVPLFGWVLMGEEEALITALFTLKGPLNNPKVSAAPASSVAKTALGIIGRTLGLPFRMLQKTGEFLTTPPWPGEKPSSPTEQNKN